MALFIVLLLAAVLIPAGAYFSYGGGGSRAWGLVAAGEEQRGRGTYRETRATLWKRGSAPLAVRVAALSSFFLGQMIVPGALAACVGLVAALTALSKGEVIPLLIVLQLSAPTGLVVAAYLFKAGAAMLARDDDAVVKARRAWRWAIGHNVALLTALGGASAVSWVQHQESELTMLAIPPAIYACFSIGQALLVRHAAASIEAYAAHQGDEPPPVLAPPAVLTAAR
jgi:hypothetical protein